MRRSSPVHSAERRLPKLFDVDHHVGAMPHYWCTVSLYGPNDSLSVSRCDKLRARWGELNLKAPIVHKQRISHAKPVSHKSNHNNSKVHHREVPAKTHTTGTKTID